MRSVTVTDEGGASDSTAQSVTATIIAHVADLDGRSVSRPRNRWDAQVDLLVQDSGGNPVAGAQVTGSWSDGASGSDSCTTGANGWCPTITKADIKGNVSSVRFSVNGLSGSGIAYDASANGDPDGDSNGTSITVFQPAANEPPTAAISEPADGATFESGSTITFSGSASDPEEGDLTASLSWSSNIDGPIGTGGSFFTTLSDGGHTITASVADSDGAEDSATISITVGSASSDPITLSASGRKVQGVHTIDMTWSPADGGNVNVMSNGVPAETTLDDGAHVYSTGNKGGGSYNIQVCETDSGDCSNIVTVSF